MPTIVVQSGPFTVTVRYLLNKRGVFYYYRRVPDDLVRHYGKRFIRESLRTRSLSEAARKVRAKASRDDAVFSSLRSRRGQDNGVAAREVREQALKLLSSLGVERGDAKRDNPSFEVFEAYLNRKYDSAYDEAREQDDPDRALQLLLSGADFEALKLVFEDPKGQQVMLSDALEVYIRQHQKGSNQKFVTDVRRSLQHVFEVSGDLSLGAYKRPDARSLVDHLLSAGCKTRTVRRHVTAICAVFNVGRREFDQLAVSNPYESVSIPGEGKDAAERLPYELDQLAAIEAACREKDDDMRHVVALLIDTGARMGEIVGLRTDDVALDVEAPHLLIREHLKLGRSLKTKNSDRVVPLIGCALWAAERAKAETSSAWLFPRYAEDGRVKSGSASAAIGKWLRPFGRAGQTAHSFRHTMRDRLTNAGVPRDIIEEIGGWGEQTIGMRYGKGHTAAVLLPWMVKVVRG